MAKRRGARARARRKPEDEIYVFLIENTELGSKDEVLWKEGALKVSKQIRDFGGDCTFYVTTGEAYDGVSVATGLSPSQAVAVARLIDSFGTVKGTRLSGVQMTK